MAPSNLNVAQIALIILIVKKSQASLTSEDWDDIATELGCKKAAAKERFRFLMAKLKAADGNGGDKMKPEEKEKTTPKKRAKKVENGEEEGSSAKKPKAESALKKKTTDIEEGVKQEVSKYELGKFNGKNAIMGEDEGAED